MKALIAVIFISMSSTVFAGDLLLCNLHVDVAIGSTVESKLIFTGDLLPYNSLYIDTLDAKMADCKSVKQSCVGNLYVRTSKGISSGLFLHIGRIVGISEGSYDVETDITLSDVKSDLHLSYWREKALILDCKMPL